MPEQQQQRPRPRQPLTPRPANHKLDNDNIHQNDSGDIISCKSSKKKLQVKGGGGNDGRKLDAAKQQQLLQEELALRLRSTADMLNVESGIEDLYCAGDLVAFAIGSGWLGEGDFLC